MEHSPAMLHHRFRNEKKNREVKPFLFSGDERPCRSQRFPTGRFADRRRLLFHARTSDNAHYTEAWWEGFNRLVFFIDHFLDELKYTNKIRGQRILQLFLKIINRLTFIKIRDCKSTQRFSRFSVCLQMRICCTIPWGESTSISWLPVSRRPSSSQSTLKPRSLF